MLFLEFALDVVVRMPVQGCQLVKEARMFTVFHHYVWVTGTIDLPDSIPIGTGTICHESLEVDRFKSMPSHNFVETLPHDALGLTILGLHITDCYCHHSTIP